MKFSESTENRIRPENRYLHGIRMVTNSLLTGQIAAFAGLLTGTSPVRILSACAVLAAFTLAADRIQHRIRAFGRYSIRMLTAAGVSCLLLLFLNRALFPVHAGLIILFMLSLSFILREGSFHHLPCRSWASAAKFCWSCCICCSATR